MKNNFRLAGIMLLCALVFTACKKNKDVTDTPPIDESTITPVGSPLGTAITKTIGQTGGELSSVDGTIKVIIPQGALEAAQEFSIQPITNELPAGIGNAFRILPHGQQFKKPVTIVFHYAEEDVAGSLPEFLDIAYQDSTGSWVALMNAALDKANRQLTITTTHFSDWGYFKSLNLTPEAATVALGGSVDLKVTTHFPYIDPDDVPAGQEAIKVLKEPRELQSREIERWSYTGEGILISRGSQAFYTAPDQTPEANPEAVVAHIHMARKGQFMLISNITVAADDKLAYLQVDEDYKSPLNNGDCRIYMYGSFGNDPGASKRNVKIGGQTVEVDLWTPNVIRCKIDREISGAIEINSNNKTITRSVLGKWTGHFVYERFQGGKANSRSSNPLKEMTEFTIVYRGFGAPCPSYIDPILETDGMLTALGTRADYKLGGAATVTPPGVCPRISSVSVPEGSGTLLLNTISGSPDNRLDVRAKDTTGGIEVAIYFTATDVVTGVQVKRSDCNITFLDPPRSLWVGLEGFVQKPIQLAFTESGGLKLKGTDELKSGNVASNILVEAWDGSGSPSHYETDGLMPTTFKNK